LTLCIVNNSCLYNSDFVSLIITFFLFRVASIIQQFTSGLNSCGRLWEVVLNNWKAFLPLFTNTRGALTRNEVRDLFNIVWSSPGSNRGDLEEETVFLWECWLMLIQGKCFFNCTLFCYVIRFCFLSFTFSVLQT